MKGKKKEAAVTAKKREVERVAVKGKEKAKKRKGKTDYWNDSSDSDNEGELDEDGFSKVIDIDVSQPEKIFYLEENWDVNIGCKSALTNRLFRR